MAEEDGGRGDSGARVGSCARVTSTRDVRRLRCPNEGSSCWRVEVLDNSDPVPLPVASASAHVQSEADSKHNQTLEWPAWTHHSK